MNAAEPEVHRGTVADRVLGLVGGTMVVIALALLIRGCIVPGPEDGEAADVPAIRLVEAARSTPAEGLAVVFETDAALRRGPAGWEADTLHLHADLGGRMVMSDMGEVVELEGSRYRWTIPPAAVPPGEQPLFLYWAGPSHRRIDAGATAPITIPAP